VPLPPPSMLWARLAFVLMVMAPPMLGDIERLILDYIEVCVVIIEKFTARYSRVPFIFYAHSTTT
jgi:hypothetical protein